MSDIGKRALGPGTFGGNCAICLRRLWCPLVGWGISFLVFSFVYLALDHRVTCRPGSSGGAIAETGGELHRSALHKSMAAAHECSKDEIIVNSSIEQTTNDTEHEEESPWHCEHPRGLHEFHLLECAALAGRRHERRAKALAADPSPKPPRVAFMFLTRGDMPHEPVWKNFFQGHEDHYSIYVHTAQHYMYSTNSFFHGHQVPNLSARRLSMTLVDAMRRLLAYAILDPEHGAENTWFVFACESTIPVRSFNFTYDYLMKSELSFVESFHPITGHRKWATDVLPLEQVRKGEMWMALQLRHVNLVLDDWKLYYKFKRYCSDWCAPDEQYIQTLLGLKDPGGIANRTVTYVDWTKQHHDSPFLFDSKNLVISWFEDIQNRTSDSDGEYHDTSSEADKTKIRSRTCYYNGIPDSQCFLFARKVHNSTTKYLQSLLPILAGY